MRIKRNSIVPMSGLTFQARNSGESRDKRVQLRWFRGARVELDYHRFVQEENGDLQIGFR